MTGGPILVTGAGGLLGGTLIRMAQQLGKDVVAAYRRELRVVSLVRSVQIDLTNANEMQKLVHSLRPAWIIHCAAATHVDWCETNETECYLINVEATRNLALSANACGAGFVYISTDSVFDGATGNYVESDSPSPINVYARSKLRGEQVVQKVSPSALILRTNFYGGGMKGRQSLAEWVLSRLKQGDVVSGFTDVWFSPLWVEDLASLIFGMIDRRLAGLYHVASQNACSKHEFACQVADVFDFDRSLIKPASVADAQLKAPRPLNTSLNTAHVSRTLGRSMPSWESGLQRFKALMGPGLVYSLSKSEVR